MACPILKFTICLIGSMIAENQLKTNFTNERKSRTLIKDNNAEKNASILGKDLDVTKKILVENLAVLNFTTSLVDSVIAESQIKIPQMKLVLRR